MNFNAFKMIHNMRVFEREKIYFLNYIVFCENNSIYYLSLSNFYTLSITNSIFKIRNLNLKKIIRSIAWSNERDNYLNF